MPTRAWPVWRRLRSTSRVEPLRVAWPFPTPPGAWLEAVGLGRLRDRHQAYAVGTVLLLRAAALRQVGGFDERFFLYAEETDWARRAASLGWRHGVVPTVTALHVGAATSTDATPPRDPLPRVAGALPAQAPRRCGLAHRALGADRGIGPAIGGPPSVSTLRRPAPTRSLPARSRSGRDEPSPLRGSGRERLVITRVRDRLAGPVFWVLGVVLVLVPRPRASVDSFPRNPSSPSPSPSPCSCSA